MFESARWVTDFSALKAARAFEAIEKYAANLINQPWRKEFKEIKVSPNFLLILNWIYRRRKIVQSLFRDEIPRILTFPKGQLILKCPFGVFKSTKKTMKFFPAFLPLPLKRGQIKKIRALYTTNWWFYFDYLTLLFWFDLFLEARAEILTKTSLVLGSFEDTKRIFQNWLP